MSEPIESDFALTDSIVACLCGDDFHQDDATAVGQDIAAHREKHVKAERNRLIVELQALPTFTAEYDVATGTRHQAVSAEHVQALIAKLRTS